MACTFLSPGRTRCTECNSLNLVNSECRRCDDPRCAECPGDVRVCKACRNPSYVVNSGTGRCQDPSWPAPCRQSSGGAGRRPGCSAASAGPQKPRPAQAGRWVVRTHVDALRSPVVGSVPPACMLPPCRLPTADWPAPSCSHARGPEAHYPPSPLPSAGACKARSSSLPSSMGRMRLVDGEQRLAF